MQMFSGYVSDEEISRNIVTDTYILACGSDRPKPPPSSMPPTLSPPSPKTVADVAPVVAQDHRHPRRHHHHPSRRHLRPPPAIDGSTKKGRGGGKERGRVGRKKKEWGGEGEMPTLSGREEGREKKRGERDGVFSHADHLTCPYIFACGPIKRSVYEN